MDTSGIIRRPTEGFGERFDEWRRRLGYSTAECARRIGVSTKTVRRWINGRIPKQQSVLKCLVRLLGPDAPWVMWAGDVDPSLGEDAGPGLVLITGPMFAGKTSALLAAYRRAVARGRKAGLYVVAVPGLPNRTHNGQEIHAFPVDDLRLLPGGLDVYCVDEVQFASEPGVEFLLRLAGDALVVCAGLDLDYRGRPWEATGILAGMADRVIRLRARCGMCGAEAVVSHRASGSAERVDPTAQYVPLCRRCFLQHHG